MKGLLLVGRIRCDLYWSEHTLTAAFQLDMAMERQIRLGSGYRFSDHTAEKKVVLCNSMKLTAIRV